MKKNKRIYYDLNYIKSEELKMLIKFDEVCNKYNIRYSLSGGTLLGAVRHGGFIPWDDDIDVIMIRKDYEKFCNVFDSEYDENYYLQNYLTDSEYINNFAKILNLDIPALIEETENLSIKKGLCIDIFPVDKAPNNFLFRQIFIIKLSICSILKYSMLEKNEHGIKRIIHHFIRFFIRKGRTISINQWENNIRKKYNATSSNITYGDFIKPPYKLSAKDIQPYDMYEYYTTMQFENHSFSVIKNYKKYLELTYGEYEKLPPPEDQKPGHNFYHY